MTEGSHTTRVPEAGDPISGLLGGLLGSGGSSDLLGGMLGPVSGLLGGSGSPLDAVTGLTGGLTSAVPGVNSTLK